MFNFTLPKYRTYEEVLELRRHAIENSGALNTEWALKEFDKNPDVEFDWVTIKDVWEQLGIECFAPNEQGRWLVLRGKKPDIMVDGMKLEDFKKKHQFILKEIEVV